MSDSVITPCPHDFALAEWCPMCQHAEIERLRADNEALRQELAKFSAPKADPGAELRRLHALNMLSLNE